MVAAATAAAAHHGFYVRKVVSDRYFAPLQFAVGQRIWVADTGMSTLSTAAPYKVYAHGGDPKREGDLAGVGLNSAAGEAGYVWTNGRFHNLTKFSLLRNGKLVYEVNLAAYEGRVNPDGRTHYGVINASTCVKKALQQSHIPVTYTGDTDSHPYAVAYAGHGGWLVADAGGNDILAITPAAHTVRTFALLPRQPFIVSSAFAKASHLPACTIGQNYWTESVPTDVEVGQNGTVYATTLPGGPEGPGVGPRGSVYSISADGGVIKRLGTGFADPTNLAVRPNGYIYVAELGAQRISRLVNGRPSPLLSVKGVVGVEWANNRLYASTAPGVFGAHKPGKIIELGYI